MSNCSAKSSLRFYFLSAAVWLSAAPAFGQDAASVTLHLSPVQAAAVLDAMDARAQLPTLATSDAFWQVQAKLKEALDADPKGRRAFEDAYTAIPRGVGP